MKSKFIFGNKHKYYTEIKLQNRSGTDQIRTKKNKLK